LEKESGVRSDLKTQIDELNKSLEENLDQVNNMEGDLIEAQKSYTAWTSNATTSRARSRFLAKDRIIWRNK
jgi:hypothetical protein